MFGICGLATKIETFCGAGFHYLLNLFMSENMTVFGCELISRCKIMEIFLPRGSATGNVLNSLDASNSLTESFRERCRRGGRGVEGGGDGAM